MNVVCCYIVIIRLFVVAIRGHVKGRRLAQLGLHHIPSCENTLYASQMGMDFTSCE